MEELRLSEKILRSRVKNLTNELSVYKRGPTITSTFKKATYQKKRTSSTEKSKCLAIQYEYSYLCTYVCENFYGSQIISSQLIILILMELVEITTTHLLNLTLIGKIKGRGSKKQDMH